MRVVNFVSPNITETCCAMLTVRFLSFTPFDGTEMDMVCLRTVIIKVIELLTDSNAALINFSIQQSH